VLHIIHESLKLSTGCSMFTDRSGHQKFIASQSCQSVRHRPRLCHTRPLQRHSTWGFSHMVLLHPSYDFWRSRAFQMEPFRLN